MNKDDMSDDAEFDAFLNREGELARRLQGLAQPAPSAALDAAILANARAAMAQEARPAAANDGGDSVPAPRLAPGLGWRWRVPAGIAASVLVGVFAVQTFEAGGDLNAVAPAPEAPQAVIVTVPAAPAVAAPPAELMAPAPPPPPLQRQAEASSRVQAEIAPAPAPVVQAKPESPEIVAEEARGFGPPPAPPAPAPSPISPPVSAVEMARPAMPAKQSKPVSPVMADSADKAEAAADAYSLSMKRAQPAPAPPAEYKITGNRRATVDEVISGDVGQAPAAAGKAAPVPAREWLDRIETLLAQGRRPEAVAQWKAFRKVYPEYPVTDVTRSQLE